MTVGVIKKMILTIGGIIAALAAAWYGIFGLKSYTVTEADFNVRYAYHMEHPVQLQLSALTEYSYDFTYISFDGANVNGRIMYPDSQSASGAPIPVLIGIHAMGRSQIRWWQDHIDGRPTVEQVDKITAMALDKGYAVIAIDARNHGLRKIPEHSINDILHNMHWWGKRRPYEELIVDTVRDYRVLLDWIEQQPQFDITNIRLAGYSMGAQISLLLAAVDERIGDVAAIVPPHVSNTTAIVAPQNILTGLADNHIWLLTADSDEYATKKQNTRLFNALPGPNKQHISFDSGHLLPADYVETLRPWF